MRGGDQQPRTGGSTLKQIRFQRNDGFVAFRHSFGRANNINAWGEIHSCEDLL